MYLTDKEDPQVGLFLILYFNLFYLKGFDLSFRFVYFW